MFSIEFDGVVEVFDFECQPIEVGGHIGLKYVPVRSGKWLWCADIQ